MVRVFLNSNSRIVTDILLASNLIAPVIAGMIQRKNKNDPTETDSESLNFVAVSIATLFSNSRISLNYCF